METTADLQTKVNRYRPGDKLEVTYLRRGKEDKKTVVLRNIAGTTGVVTPGTASTDIFGATFAPLTATERDQLNIENGVKITSITDGRLRDLGHGQRNSHGGCKRTESEQRCRCTQGNK